MNETNKFLRPLVHGAVIASVHMLNNYIVSKVSFNRNSRCRCATTCKMPKKQTIHHLLNPLNAELNPICHLLVLLGDLTFMGPCILCIFQYIYPTRCNVTQFI